MKKALGSLLITLTLLTASMPLAGCGLSIPGLSPDSNAGNANNQQAAPDNAGSSDSSTYQDGLPASFTAYNNLYTIENFKIETNEDGNTVVICEGSGFTKLPMRNNSFQMPLSCILIVDGSEKSWISGSAWAQGIEFEFDGVYQPETLVFLAGDDESQRVEVPAGVYQQIKLFT